MRDLLRAARPVTALAAAGAAAAVLVAGCTSLAAPAGQPISRTSAAPQRATRLTGPARPQHVPSRTRREAQILARQILGRLLLPSGAVPVHPGHLPQLLRQPGMSPAGRGWVDARSLFQLSESAPAVKRYVLAHRPAGARLLGTGQGSSGEITVQFNLVPPSGFEQTALVLSVIPHAGGSMLRADGQVIWFPARSAAEHLAPGQFKSVRLSARVLNPRPHTVRRVITSRKAIARLAQLLNGFPVQPDLVTSCPASWVTYTFAFAATAGGPARTLITDTGCQAAAVRAGGKAQPALQDTAGQLYQAAQQLIPVKAPS